MTLNRTEETQEEKGELELSRSDIRIGSAADMSKKCGSVSDRQSLKMPIQTPDPFFFQSPFRVFQRTAQRIIQITHSRFCSVFP